MLRGMRLSLHYSMRLLLCMSNYTVAIYIYNDIICIDFLSFVHESLFYFNLGGLEDDNDADTDTYKKALEKGKRNIAYGRMMLLGTARVGKSSLKRSLMKLPFECKSPSTIVADFSSVRPLIEWQAADLGDDVFRVITVDDDLDELAQLVHALVQQNDSSESTDPETTPTVNIRTKDVTLFSQDIGKVEEILSEAIERAIQKSDDVNMDEPQPFLHMWDCGGQPVFLEILPAFLTPRTMFLLLFDASKPLNENWHSVISSEEGKDEFVEEVDQTTLEMLLSWMANVHSHLIKYDNGAFADYPRMYCIGTHGDKLEEQKKKEVMEELKSHCKVFGSLIKGTLIVDNTTSGLEKEDSNLSELRRAICRYTLDKFVKNTPVIWVLFQKVIRQYTKKVISLEEAHAIGKACKISVDDVPDVLEFYHDLGVLLFYPHIKGLQNVVIIDPKWFVDILGRIFTQHKRDTSDKTLECELLNEKGILVQPYYHDESIWRGCEGLDPNGIMELLIHFRLAAEVHTKEYYQAVKHYFLPAVLKSFNRDPNEVPSECRKHAAPLHIVFPTIKLTPPGFFTRLATVMASHSFCELVFEYGIYRNRVTFLCGLSKIDRVILTDLHYAMQVNVLRCLPDSHSHQSFNAICQELLTVLEECVTDVKETLNHGRSFGNKTFAFPIPHHEFKFACGNCRQSRYAWHYCHFTIHYMYLILYVTVMASSFFLIHKLTCAFGHTLLMDSTANLVGYHKSC